MAARPAVIGAAIHSGWAAIVALGGEPTDPQILLRSRIEMVNEHDPGAKQPYHCVESMELESARQRLDAYTASAQSRAGFALDAIQRDLESRDYQLGALGLLDSSGRTGEGLAIILASHTLIHTADGNHFRTALAAAAQARGLRVHRVNAKTLDGYARAHLSLAADAIDRTLASFRDQVRAPWGADQKKAALLAWTLLSPVQEL
jgi:hypothetical protein